MKVNNVDKKVGLDHSRLICIDPSPQNKWIIEIKDEKIVLKIYY